MDPNNINILVAEDELANQILLKHYLKEYNLTIVKNGKEAVDMYKQGNYDVVLMDYQMPVMNGAESTHEIIKYDHTAKIIFLTAYNDQHILKECYEAGAKEVLHKPYEPSMIKDTIHKHVD